MTGRWCDVGEWELRDPGGECCLRGLQYLYGGPPPPAPPAGDRLRFLIEKSKGASSGEEVEVATE